MKLRRLLPLLLSLATVRATTLPVTSTADSGAGSLRAQIAAAATGDSIAIAATGTITLTTGEIVVTGKDLVITGPGADSLIVTTNATRRALRFVNAQSTISGITFHNCKGLPGDVDTGGAIAVDNFTAGGGTKVTTINDCAFTNNQSGWGGAVDIFNGGLVMNRCTFSGNTCTGLAFGTNGGGAALSIGPTLASTLTNCTFSANTQNGVAAGQAGGAIYNYGAVPTNPPPLTVEHCTFVGNVDASGAAGAMRGNYTASYQTRANLRNCLLANNQAPVSVLKNFSGNLTGPLTASYTSLGGNVTDESATSAQFMPAPTDKVNNAALSGSVAPALALNGGSTKTHAITRGSPAQRSGSASAVTADQRGAPRHSTADAGAFELIEPELALAVASSPIGNNGTLAFGSTPFDTAVVKTITITNTQTSSFTSGPLTLGNLALPAGYSASGFPAISLGNGESVTFDVTLLPSPTGLHNAPLSFTGNDSFDPALATAAQGMPNLHVLNLSGLVTDTADHWREQYFGIGATNSGPAADTANPTGDGISNLLKYSLGLNPQVAYPPGTGWAMDIDPAGFLRLTVSRNPAAADLSLAVEVSGDLSTTASWSAAATTIEQNSLTLLQARDNIPILSAPNRFIRLKVSRP